LTHHFDVGDFARLTALVSEVSNGRSDTSRGTTIIRFLPGNKSRAMLSAQPAAAHDHWRHFGTIGAIEKGNGTWLPEQKKGPPV